MTEASPERQDTLHVEAELQEPVKIDATPDRLADAVLPGGAARREKEEA